MKGKGWSQKCLLLFVLGSLTEVVIASETHRAVLGTLLVAGTGIGCCGGS